MMRYRLRTMLIVLAIGPMVLAAVWPKVKEILWPPKPFPAIIHGDLITIQPRIVVPPPAIPPKTTIPVMDYSPFPGGYPKPDVRDGENPPSLAAPVQYPTPVQAP